MIITCIVMLVSVFLTYKISNYLGLNLQIKPLLFCAFFALLINFTLPMISLYISQYHLIFIFGSVLFSAFFITRYNEKLISTSLSSEKMNLCTTTNYVIIEKNPEEDVLGLNKSLAINSTDAKGNLVFSKPNFFKLGRNFKKANLTVQSSKLPVIIYPTISDLVKSDIENAKLLKLTVALAKLNSLDSILEYAYDQKRQKAYSNSIFAFKQALERYETDDYAPFIVIEIGNIYKNSGLYDEAIVIYNRAFLLPSVIGSDEFSKEFQNNISYLRITKSILFKHNCSKLAFNQIPNALMQEIESEFELWRTKKYAS